MDISPLQLARIQFTGSASFLAFFLPMALALAWVLLFFKWRARVTRDPGWTAAYRFWVRVYALAFVLTLAGSVPLLFQLGSLWAGLMDKIGNVAGPLIGYAVLSVFIFKSCFLGVMLFGQRRVSPGVHTFSIFMVAIGQMAAVFWVVVLQSWLETPTGARFFDGRYQVFDWPAVVLNPALGWQLGLYALTAALSAAFLIMGVTAWQALRRPLDHAEKLAFKAAVVLGALAVVLQIPVGVGSARVTALHQPAKAAAVAAYWETGSQPGFTLWGIPDSRQKHTRYDMTVAHGSTLLGQDAITGQFQGLDTYSGMHPPVGPIFFSVRAAVLLAIAMGLTAWVVFLRVRNRGFDPSILSRASLRGVSLLMFAGSLSGVLHTWIYLFGLQPYAVNGTVTQTEILGPATAGSLALALTSYTALYVLLIVAFLAMLFHAARYGVIPVRKVGRAA